MPRKRAGAALAALLLTALGLAACSAGETPGADSDDRAPDAALSAAALPARNAVVSEPLAEMQNTPAPQPSPDPAVVRVWWPDELYPEDSAAQDELQGQFDLFGLTYTNYGVEVRRKRTAGLGGILTTLHTAGPVAPGALPDLTLMRRTDMIAAAQDGLIAPIGDWAPSDLGGSNLFPGVRALGEVNGELYGVPYALTLYHTVYRASVFEQQPATFDDVLAAETPFLFPGGAAPVSWTILLQYYAAGGRLMDQDGAATLTSDALMVVLDFYARGAESGVFSTDLLDYVAYGDYWNAFVTGESSLVSVNTETYLRLKDSAPNAGLAPVPTADGTPVAMVDGWMWVLTTQNPDHQQRALAFLSWMMRISQQSAFTEAFGVLPSQTRALRLWEDEAYADFAQDLLVSDIVVPEERRNNAAATALQNAVEAVLRGATPEAAAEDALRALNE